MPYKFNQPSSANLTYLPTWITHPHHRVRPYHQARELSIAFAFRDPLKLNASISASAMLNPTTSPNPPPPVALSSPSGHSGAIMESTLRNSERPQRRAATRAAENLTQIATEHSPTEDAPKKKTPAAFQLSDKVIPNDAGHIKVSSP